MRGVAVLEVVEIALEGIALAEIALEAMGLVVIARLAMELEVDPAVVICVWMP